MAADIQNEDNMVAANATFEGFMGMLTYGAIGAAFVVALVLFLITR